MNFRKLASIGGNAECARADAIADGGHLAKTIECVANIRGAVRLIDAAQASAKIIAVGARYSSARVSREQLSSGGVRVGNRVAIRIDFPRRPTGAVLIVP